MNTMMGQSSEFVSEKGSGETWETNVKNLVEEKFGSEGIFKAQWCRRINVAQQLEQDVWKVLLHIEWVEKRLSKLGDQDSAMRKSWLEKLLDAELKIKESIHPKNTVGPVGNYPIHDCILLGHFDLAKSLISEHPALLRQAYESDLGVWEKCVRISDTDGGLYTGETVLHLAIGRLGKRSTEFVTFLLEQGRKTEYIDTLLQARATGLFFSPPWIREEKPSILRGLLSPTSEPCYANKMSRCYYGELPLSFAASVGNCEVCIYIRSYLRRPDLKNPVELWRNALFKTDKCKNTALHMAVIHRQLEVVNWILDAEEELCAEEDLRLPPQVCDRPVK